MGPTPILCYHTVDAEWTSRLSVPPDRFAEQARWLARHRRVVDLDTAVRIADRRWRLPRGAVALTFDDGLIGVQRHALPVLRRLGLPATLFVVAETLTDERAEVDWVDGVAPGRLATVTLDELRELAEAGVTVGSHSARHHRLTQLSATECEADLRRSRVILEDLLGTPIRFLAYPRGLHDHRVREAARRAGYSHAFALPEAPEDPGPFAIPRIGVYAHNGSTTVKVKATRAYEGFRTGPAHPRAARARRAVRDLVGGRNGNPAPAPPSARRIGVVMSRFPKVTETFVLDEILALERLGRDVEILPLLRERPEVAHPEALPLVARARYAAALSPAVVASQLSWLRRDPRRYVATVAEAIRGTRPSRRFLLRTLVLLPRMVHLATQVRRLGIEHVHAHFATHPALAALVVHRLTGVPYSFTAHGSDLHVDRTMLCEKVAAAAFVVTISEHNRRIIERGCPGARVHVVHCGVNLDRFRPVGPPGDRATLEILCIGTLHEVKGQAVLLEACARLREEGVPFRCTFVGDGPDRAALEEQADRDGIAGSVRFLGARPRADVRAALASSDVVVAPSVPAADGRREGIPVVLMEAMASGLPVVASRLSGIPELVEDGRTGVLIEPGDASGLASALVRLARDPADRRRLGDAGRHRVEAEFDLDASAARVAALIDAAVAG